VNSLVVSIPVSQQSLSQRRSSETLCDNKGIVAERVEKFAQYFGLFGVLRHAIHFSL
jgi:hypothetical protein